MLKKIIKFLDRNLNTTFYRYKYNNRSLKVGSGALIYCKSVILGDNVQIDQNVIINGELKGKITIGDNSKINSYCKIDTTGTLIIGKNTVISEYTKVYTHGHGGDPYSEPRPYTVEIGDNVWIGASCIILPSARRIETNTIVPAGSVLR